MNSVNIHEAKTNLSRLLQRVERGEEIIIARSGKPIAKIVAYERDMTPRTPGAWRGKVRMADDFDELPDDLLAAFQGNGT